MSVITDSFPTDKTGLEEYNELRKLSNALIQQKIQQARDYTIPVKKSSLRTLSSMLNTVMSVQSFMDLLDTLEIELKENLKNKPSDENKNDKVSELNMQFRKIYDKALSDNKINKSVLDDIKERFKAILSAYLDGDMVGIQVKKDKKKYLQLYLQMLLKQ